MYGRNDDDLAGDFGPNDTPPVDPSMATYEDIGRDENGVNRYRGPDGQIYTDGQGPNGFVPYTPQAAQAPQTPTDPTPVPSPTGPGPGPSGYNAPWVPPQGSTTTSYLQAAPQFTPPGYTKPAPFAYADFVAPTGKDVLSDPGYAFREQRGLQQLQNNKAAQGVLNTGGALKDFVNYNQNFATQEYGNVWDRSANAYSMNRNNAADAYRTNYDTQFKDPYQFSYQAALDQFAPQMQEWQTNSQASQRQNELNQQYSWAQYLEDDRRRRDDRDFGASRSDTNFNQRRSVID